MPEPYRITGIRKRPDIDDQGHFVEVYEVSFTTAKGAVSSLKIPAKSFQATEAKRLVAEEARNLDSLLPS
jgi:hypothetical protein